MKEDIQQVLRHSLQQGLVGNQQQLTKYLQNQGYKVSQSTVSRLLRKIKAIKVKNQNGKLVYSLTKEPPPPRKSDTLAHILLEITHNEQLIVLHTSPGGAQLIARTIDYYRQQMAILGTIAGDDTVFVAIQKGTIEQTIKAIKQLLLQQKTDH